VNVFYLFLFRFFNESEMVGETGNTLTKSPVSILDAGKYACVATTASSGVSVEASSKLTVSGKDSNFPSTLLNDAPMFKIASNIKIFILDTLYS